MFVSDYYKTTLSCELYGFCATNHTGVQQGEFNLRRQAQGTLRWNLSYYPVESIQVGTGALATGSRIGPGSYESKGSIRRVRAHTY